MRGHLKPATRRVVRVSAPLAAVAVLLSASAAFGELGDSYTPPPAPVPGKTLATYLAMTGAKSNFIGGVTQQGHKGQIQVLALDFGLKVPRDPATGLPTGRLICQGVNFRKPTDRSTPLLFGASAANESILTAVFTEVRASPVGVEEAFFTVKLTNASISSMHAVTATTTGAYEDVTLVPQRVEVTWAAGNITAAFDCASRPV